MPLRGWEGHPPETQELLMAVRQALSAMASSELDDALSAAEQRLWQAEQDYLIKNAVA
jgi:hypothetical protein